MKLPKIVKHILKDWDKNRTSGWLKGRNNNTLKKGYWIEHAGSLWLGQPSTQNTLQEILELGKEMGWQDASLESSRNFLKKEFRERRVYCFHGNMARLSNAFNVWIWNPKFVRLVRKSI